MLRGCALQTSLTLALAACGSPSTPSGGWVDPVTGVRLVLAERGKHPYLADHERVLFIESAAGSMHRVDLHPCAGTPVHSNLYRLTDQRLLLVDANGVWITLTRNGDVESRRWWWGKRPVGDFLGCFRANGGQDYVLDDGAEPDIYLFKDPPTGVEHGV